MTLFSPEPDQPEEPRTPADDLSQEPRLLTRRRAESADAATAAAVEEDAARERTPRPVRRRRVRRAGRFALATLLGLTALTVLLVVVGTMWMRHAMRASLPELDGTLHAAGLSAPVTVSRDEHGVPSISGANVDDIIFAQGYVTAQDRLWQMDSLRRHAAGELAEVLGSSLVPHDRMQRTLQMRAAAERGVAALPADQRHQLEVYARGVNAFIDANGDRLPLEFRLLHYKPAPWTARDSLLVSLAMSQDLATEFPTKLSRETLSAHLPPQLMADLYPVGNWRDHPPGKELPDLTSPRPDILQIPLDPSQVKAVPPHMAPEDIQGMRAAMLQSTCEGCVAGSNNWAVSGAHSASGAPLVSNDMHLGLSVPDIWYEAGLHAADGSLDVSGVTLPGTPFVIVGRNAHVAWGFTNLGGDVQDVYVEHTRGTGAGLEFERVDGSWAPALHHREHIRVRGGSDVDLDVVATQHEIGATTIETPVISGLYPKETRTLSLAWTPYDPSNLSSPFLGVNQAASGAALNAALANFGGPSLNLVWGDDGNHIGYHAVGRIPVRGQPVRHSRVAGAADAPGPAAGEAAPPASDEDGSAMVRGGNPYLVLAGFRPRRPVQRAAGGPVRAAGQGAARAGRAAAAPKQVAKQVPEAPIAPAAPAIDYTIGSPIPTVPVDAMNTEAQWSGYVPYAELPAVVDPPAGLLATANARVTPDDYPYALANDWISPYRVERIVRLLAGRNGLTPDDMLRTQMDIHSEMNLVMAQRLAYALDHAAAGKNSARLHAAADLLRQWDGSVTADSAAPTLVAATRQELWFMLLVPQVMAHDGTSGNAGKKDNADAIAALYTWGEQGAVLEELVTHAPVRWLPPGFGNWDDLLAAAVDRALAVGHAPADLNTWSYGKAHPIAIEHPLLSGMPLVGKLLGVRTGSGPRAAGGDTSTIKASSQRFGPSERFTADLHDSAANTLNITTGQSGNPASPWFFDQFEAWLKGTTFPAPLHGSANVHTLTLAP